MQRIWTLGHSTRSLDDFVEVLRHHDVRQIADVRAYPGSRRHPHFGREALQQALSARGLVYAWMPGLGGRRRATADSQANKGWRVEAFRAYADYMATESFQAALNDLEVWARAQNTAYMCAEAVHFRCHRWLISDALVARGWSVLHLASTQVAKAHVLTDFAQVDSSRRLTYPGQGALPWHDEEGF